MKILIEKKNDLIQELESLVLSAETETRAFSEEEDLRAENLKAEILKINSEILEKQEQRNLEKNTEKSEVEKEMENRELELRELENKMVAFINGDTRALGVGANGGMIPDHVANTIIEKVAELSPLYAMATKFNVGGNIKFVKENAVQTATYVDDLTELTEGNPTFATVTLNNFIIGTLSKVSKSLMNRSDFDLLSYVVNRVAKAIAEFLEKELVNGTSGKIRGLAGSTNTVTSSVAGAINVDDLIDAQMSICETYQANACWIMHKNTLKALRKLKTTDGEYILNRDLNSAFGWSLLGKPVYITESAPAVATGNKAVFYGDMTGLYVKLAQNVEVQVLTEKYATQHAIGVVGYVEVDAEVVEDQKICVLKVK